MATECPEGVNAGDAARPGAGTHRPASRLALILAFAAVYILWGSTYLAIRVAVEALPPFLMAGTRFLTAGALLYAWARWGGAPAPSGRQWAAALVAGALMLGGGNGGVVWAEKTVPSGLAALVVATVPVWVALADWLRPGGVRPPPIALLGLALGLAGVAWLAGPGTRAEGTGFGAGVVVLVLASLSWSVGTVFTRHAPRPRSALLGAGMQMLAGGCVLALGGLFAGEATRFDPARVTAASLWAVVYLVMFGALVAYTAYAWLLNHVRPTLVATYAFVNPVVAVLLGWALAGERLPPEALTAGGVVVVAVALVVAAGNGRRAR
jgi:drug/metabolite transporter (DMT)-like permease